MLRKQRNFGHDLFGFRNDIDKLANNLFSKNKRVKEKFDNLKRSI